MPWKAVLYPVIDNATVKNNCLCIAPLRINSVYQTS